MKRAFFLLAVLATLVPITAFAGTKLTTIDVNWTQQRSAIRGGFIDSVEARAIGTATPTAHDTSSWIDIRDLVLPLDAADGSSTADSVQFLRIDFFPTRSSPTVGVDTLYVTIQVSNDGVKSGVSCTPTSIFDTTTDSALGAIILEQGTTNTAYIGATVIPTLGKLFLPQRSSSTAPTWQQLYGWPYMRLIVQSDRTGPLDAKITGFVPAN